MARKNPKIEEAEAELKKLEAAGELDKDVSDAIDDVAEEQPEVVNVISSVGEVTAIDESVSDVEAPSAVASPEYPAAVLDAFVLWAKEGADTDLAPFVEAGLLDKKHSLTDEGIRVLDAEQIGWRTLYFIKVGTQLKLVDGTVILGGSSLMILNGGRTKDGSPYWIVFAGENLPSFEVHQHRQHQFWQANYPLAVKIGAKYSKRG